LRCASHSAISLLLFCVQNQINSTGWRFEIKIFSLRGKAKQSRLNMLSGQTCSQKKLIS
jgi:hypothetical protein